MLLSLSGDCKSYFWEGLRLQKHLFISHLVVKGFHSLYIPDKCIFDLFSIVRTYAMFMQYLYFLESAAKWTWYDFILYSHYHHLTKKSPPSCACRVVVLLQSCCGFRWTGTKKHLPASLLYYISEARNAGRTTTHRFKYRINGRHSSEHLPRSINGTIRSPCCTYCNIIRFRVVRARQGSLAYNFSRVTTPAWEKNRTWLEG